MNIAWITNISENESHKTSRLKMSESLKRRGHNVNLFMVKKFCEKKYDSENITYIPTLNIPNLSGIFYGLIVFFYFPIMLNKKKPDIIIIDGIKIPTPFIISLKILNVPLILDIRTLPIDTNKSLVFKISICLSQYIVDGITTITPELSKTLRDSFNIKNKKIGIWSSGVSISDFDKTDNKNIEFSLTDGKFILIYHGNYSPTRGIENIIKAINKLDLSFKNEIKLLIVGMPEDKIRLLSKLSENEEVKEQVDILPKVSYRKIGQYLKMADVGVIPLPPENKWWKVSAPLKTLEYLAAGKPIIATNIPFHFEIFEKGDCGVLLENSSPTAIAEGISYLYNNLKFLKKMGNEGKKIVRNYYTWDIMAKKFEFFLKQFVD